MVFFFIIILLNFGKLAIGTNKIWYGKSDNQPVELITTLNIGDYATTKIKFTIPFTNTTVNFVAESSDRNTWLGHTAKTKRVSVILAQPNYQFDHDILYSSRFKVTLSGEINGSITLNKDSGSSYTWNYSRNDDNMLLYTFACNTLSSITEGQYLSYPSFEFDANDRSTFDEIFITSITGVKNILDSTSDSTEIVSIPVNCAFSKEFVLDVTSDKFLCGLIFSSTVGTYNNGKIRIIPISGHISLKDVSISYEEL